MDCNGDEWGCCGCCEHCPDKLKHCDSQCAGCCPCCKRRRKRVLLQFRELSKKVKQTSAESGKVSTCDCGCGGISSRCGYNINNYPDIAPLKHSDYCPCGGDWSLCGDNPDNYSEKR